MRTPSINMKMVLIGNIPGSYTQTIKEYDASPNDLIEQGKFKKTNLDPTPHIQKGEFSYRGISKATNNENQAGQLNYKLGHEGVAVAFASGLGDGVYEVFAEIVNAGDWGVRIKRVYIEFLSEEDIQEMQNDFFAERN